MFLLGNHHLWLMPWNKVLQLMDAVWGSKWIWEVFEVELDNLCNLKGISWRLIFLESTVIWIICVRSPGTLAAPLWTLCARQQWAKHPHVRMHTHTHAGLWLWKNRAICCSWYSPELGWVREWLDRRQGWALEERILFSDLNIFWISACMYEHWSNIHVLFMCICLDVSLCLCMFI